MNVQELPNQFFYQLSKLFSFTIFANPFKLSFLCPKISQALVATALISCLRRCFPLDRVTFPLSMPGMDPTVKIGAKISEEVVAGVTEEGMNLGCDLSVEEQIQRLKEIAGYVFV